VRLEAPRMGHRLSKITTRTGDAGDTGLGDGSRVPKDDARIVALGDVDELNAVLGVVLAEPLPVDIVEALQAIQNDLFDLGGELSVPGYRLLTEDHVSRLEQWVAHYNANLPPLKEFILPGGTRAAALMHQARTVARRAERSVVALGARDAVTDAARMYLNRLSDLLFVLARVLNRRAGHADAMWRKPAPSDPA